MDIKKIDKMLVPKPILGVTRQYGVMGLVLGRELQARLTKYCIKANIHKSKIIRALIISYLDDKEGK